MDDTESFDRVRCCALCGGAVTVHGTTTRYYIPVDKDWLDRMMTAHSSDDFMLDRLRRAERIIVDLRAKVAEYESREAD